MSDFDECDLPKSEAAPRKAWREPALIEYDVEQVTAVAPAAAADGGPLVS